MKVFNVLLTAAFGWQSASAREPVAPPAPLDPPFTAEKEKEVAAAPPPAAAPAAKYGAREIKKLAVKGYWVYYGEGYNGAITYINDSKAGDPFKLELQEITPDVVAVQYKTLKGPMADCEVNIATNDNKIAAGNAVTLKVVVSGDTCKAVFRVASSKWDTCKSYMKKFQKTFGSAPADPLCSVHVETTEGAKHPDINVLLNNSAGVYEDQIRGAVGDIAKAVNKVVGRGQDEGIPL